MPTFTMELQQVLDLTPPDKTPEWQIGIDEYEIFDENYRATLNKNIINHFMMREIAHETVGRFRFAMRRKLLLVMPYYNGLFESTKLQYDPLSTVDLKTTSENENTVDMESSGESNTTTDSKSKTRAVNSNTPGVTLRPNADYATAMADTNSQSEGEGMGSESATSKTEGVSTSESRTTGYQGVSSELVMAYRRSLINVTELLLNDLEELFMGVWNNSDSYTEMEYLGGYYR